MINSITQLEARRIITNLRSGVPPSGHIRRFTVGRKAEVARLVDSLVPKVDARPSGFLLHANYGAGKTHLLELLEEEALDRGYAVSLVTVDSISGTRFNRMDQVIGAIFDTLKVPGKDTASHGIGSMFQRYFSTDESTLNEEQRRLRGILESRGLWNSPQPLSSIPFWIALRAWGFSNHSQVKMVIESWLSKPWKFHRKQLKEPLVESLSPRIAARSWDTHLYSASGFKFNPDGYENSWKAIRDLNLLARLSGLRGHVMLFDEFEDVIQNLRNIRWEQTALQNLLTLMESTRDLSPRYFAVTPEFVSKCRSRLAEKGIYNFEIDRFDNLPRLMMTPISQSEFEELAVEIRATYSIAFDIQTNLVSDEDLHSFVETQFRRPTPDQIRLAVRELVSMLDSKSEGR